MENFYKICKLSKQNIFPFGVKQVFIKIFFAKMISKMGYLAD